MQSFICQAFDLGRPLHLTSLRSALEHNVWQLHTTRGMFTIKGHQLQANTINIAERSAHIANHFTDNEKYIVPLPLHHAEHVYFCMNDWLYQVFPWVAGDIITADNISKAQAIAMGELLATWHTTANNLNCLECQRQPILDLAPCQLDLDNILQLQQKLGLGTLSHSTLNTFLQDYNAARVKIDQTRIICHGDLHRENIIFHPDGRIGVIDWDSAKFYHPQLDLLYLAMNWGGITGQHFQLDHYRAALEIYAKTRSLGLCIDATILAASLGTWLSWIDQQSHCLSGQNPATAEERERAHVELQISLRALQTLDIYWEQLTYAI